MSMMHKYKATWYDMNSIILIETIEGTSEENARDNAYKKYGGVNVPGPCLLLEIME